MEKAQIGIIGGSGLYQMEGITDVHEISARQKRKIRAVVDDERHAVSGRHRVRGCELLEQSGIGESPVADLNDVDATGDRRLEEVLEIGPARGDQVETAVSHRPRASRR